MCVYVCVYVGVYICKCGVYLYVCACMCVYVCVHIYVCVHVCVHVYVCAVMDDRHICVCEEVMVWYVRVMWYNDGGGIFTYHVGSGHGCTSGGKGRGKDGTKEEWWGTYKG